MRDANCVVFSGRYAGTSDYSGTFDDSYVEESSIKADALDPLIRFSTVFAAIVVF